MASTITPHISPPLCTLHLVASTGRTATNFISYCLNCINGITATHEGQIDGDKDSEPLLPLINIENATMYRDPRSAVQVAANKRGVDQVKAMCAIGQTEIAIDVAYYNIPLMQEYLRQNSRARGLGIIRDAGEFVRSASHITGEDLLPVGWPNPDKPLTAREKFIAFGRFKPSPGTPEADDWSNWDSIQRNIWLWKESNHLLLDARDVFPDRFFIVAFEALRQDPEQFWNSLAAAMDISLPSDFGQILQDAIKFRNKKNTDYQVPEISEWPAGHRKMLARASTEIEERWNNGK